MVESTIIIQIILWGLVIGSIYSLLATGLNVIFGVMKIVNFAHGEIMIMGAYISFWFWSILNLNPYIAIIFSMLSLMMIGIVIERFGFRLIRNTSKLNEIFLSLGLIFIIQNGLGLAATPIRPVKIISPVQGMSLSLGIIDLPYDFMIIFLVAIGIMIVLYGFLFYTKIGKSLRAVSQNRVAAMLVGINASKVDMITFGIGSSLAAVAGSLFGMLNTFDPYTGTIPAIKAFAIIILGGLGSIPGALIGSIAYGVTESLGTFILGGAWRDAIAFALLIVVLIIRPKGLFGEGKV
ncbi:MAG: branched-chain amino acid ABC transporter permease [Asgard group archaeon]|nr:branched-chain amino acid ABC transporter permease [Asgard group archaeon]